MQAASTLLKNISHRIAILKATVALSIVAAIIILHVAVLFDGSGLVKKHICL